MDTNETKRDSPLFAGRHHARYIEPGVPIHVIARAFQGRHLFEPTPALNSIIVGVLGRAAEVYSEIRLHAVVFLSNHAHFMLSGSAAQISGYIGFVKREISRRWGRKEHINWPGTMWEESPMTALPTDESQEECLEYILAHSVKEGIVAQPNQWTGVHCADNLTTGRPLQGVWVNATGYGRAVRLELRKRSGARQHVERHLFERHHNISMSPIPCWTNWLMYERRRRVEDMVARICERGRAARCGRPPQGVLSSGVDSLNRRTPLPPQPWFQERRHMVCWANPRAPETRAYLDRYWRFQCEFKEASNRHRRGELNVVFPPGSCRPPTVVPLRPAA